MTQRLHKLPHDFSWKLYLLANPDLLELGIKTKQDAVSHYLNSGAKENRIYELHLPLDFNWRHYVSLYDDINNNLTKKEAILHYLVFGKPEGRSYITNNNKTNKENPNNNKTPITTPKSIIKRSPKPIIKQESDSEQDSDQDSDQDSEQDSEQESEQDSEPEPIPIIKTKPSVNIEIPKLRNKNHIIIDSKESFRLACIEESLMVNQLIIPPINKSTQYETVLIEFRVMNHLEFLIRNMILKLPSWSHTVVCGINNYTQMVDICNRISDGIKIIKLDKTNLTPSDYSEMLMTKSFWENFDGEKILIYQEDSYIFHNKIKPFLSYDYIGAPWPPNQDDNSLGVGNGGFSLRSKSKMIKVIEQVKPSDLVLGKSTKRYMENTNSYVLPEDVYFSKSLIDYRIGAVAPRYMGLNFSQESQLSTTPLGGHNFFLASKKMNINYKQLMLSSDNIFYNTVGHRGGWKTVINYGLDHLFIKHENKVNDTNAVCLIDCCEKFFLWDNNQTDKPWVGIIHTTHVTPNHLSDLLNIRKLFDCVKFKNSLSACVGLVVLSKYQLNWINTFIKYKLPRIIVTFHPVNPLTKMFDIYKFCLKGTYDLLLLGQQLRIITDLLLVESPLINEKIWLSGIRESDERDRAIALEITGLNLNQNIFEEFKDKIKMPYLPNYEDYDNIIQSSILIMPLFDAAANNSVLECIISNTPIFVTRCEGTEEYLGKDYPMFFDNINHLNSLLEKRKTVIRLYKETHKYLQKMDKTHLSYANFYSDIIKLINDI